MLPIKLGTAAEELHERAGLRPTQTEMRCPRCGAATPYSRIKCQHCGSSLTAPPPPSLLSRLWPYLAIAVVALVVVILALRGI